MRTEEEKKLELLDEILREASKKDPAVPARSSRLEFAELIQELNKIP
jgi:hypothetical protein